MLPLGGSAIQNTDAQMIDQGVQNLMSVASGTHGSAQSQKNKAVIVCYKNNDVSSITALGRVVVWVQAMHSYTCNRNGKAVDVRQAVCSWRVGQHSPHFPQWPGLGGKRRTGCLLTSIASRGLEAALRARKKVFRFAEKSTKTERDGGRRCLGQPLTDSKLMISKLVNSASHQQNIRPRDIPQQQHLVTQHKWLLPLVRPPPSGCLTA